MTPTPPRDRLAEIERVLEAFAAHNDFVDRARDNFEVSITVSIGELRAASAALTLLSEMRADMDGLAELSARATLGPYRVGGGSIQAPDGYLAEGGRGIVSLSSPRGGEQRDTDCEMLARSVNIIRKWLRSA